jgi:hypothetical protein
MIQAKNPNVFDGIVATSEILVPGDDWGTGLHRRLVEAKPGSLGAVSQNALAMYGLALAHRHHQGDGPQDIEALAKWAIPMPGMIPGHVGNIDISRSAMNGGRILTTRVGLHSPGRASSEHTGVSVRIDTDARSGQAVNASVILQGGVARDVAGNYDGEAHHTLGVLTIHENAIDGYRVNGSEGMLSHAAALPLLEECGRLITNIATNPALAR